MSKEIEVRRSREELEERAAKTEYWFDVASDMRDQRDGIAQDLEAALNAMRSYQSAMVKMQMPDPHFETIKRLCLKYHMSYEDPRNNVVGQILVDGIDITFDPADFEGTSGPEWLELVEDQDGNKHFRPALEAGDVLDAEIVDETDDDECD
jgi:hypothetical protein